MDNFLRLRATSYRVKLNTTRSRKRYTASAGKLVLGRTTLSVSMMLFIAVLGVAYLALVNARATRGFEIKELEKRVVDLQKRQSDLERQAADMQNIQNIQSQLDLSQYVPTTEVRHLTGQGFALDSSNYR